MDSVIWWYITYTFETCSSRQPYKLGSLAHWNNIAHHNANSQQWTSWKRSWSHTSASYLHLLISFATKNKTHFHHTFHHIQFVTIWAYTHEWLGSACNHRFPPNRTYRERISASPACSPRYLEHKPWKMLIRTHWGSSQGSKTVHLNQYKSANMGIYDEFP
jgi:hypothetical protein